MTLSWADLLALVQWASPESAIYRATNPEHWVTPELRMLRDIEWSARVLWWQQSKDGTKGRNQPKPQLLTEAERKAATPERERYNPRPVAETLAWLGWEVPGPN